ncbi:sulfatase-like hydrolase/transferase [Novosphingobium aerophilum]|uniref:sulfatase-like hydrolase/transferase n=1 Tax=Novosphingobium aerophilum TaxID=2839843 RepID=UPI003FD1E702
MAKRPNILVIWGDDIGWQNVSAYGLGTMGYTTPNIDSIGYGGIRFTDHYAQQSCTAGRAAFITGQYPIRSGMVTVGQPGDPLGLQKTSPCLAEVLKAAGYRTGHFGKSHLGDRNEHLPTNHGFEEFFGNSTTSTCRKKTSSATIRPSPRLTRVASRNTRRSSARAA